MSKYCSIENCMGSHNDVNAMMPLSEILENLNDFREVTARELSHLKMRVNHGPVADQTLLHDLIKNQQEQIDELRKLLMAKRWELFD